MGDKELKIIAAAFVAFALFAGGIIAFVVLKDRPAAALLEVPDTQSKQIAKTESLFGKTWTLLGPADSIQGIPIQLVGGRIEHWTNGNSEKRLLRMYAPSDVPEIQELHKEQSYINGKWIDDGKSFCVTKSGQDESDYVSGEMHGIHRAWYKNGQLWQETPYVNGKREGTGRGWNEDGSQQWEATYEKDVEVAGQQDSRKAIFIELCTTQEITQKQIDEGLDLLDQSGKAWRTATMQSQYACSAYIASVSFKDESLLVIAAISGMVLTELSRVREFDMNSSTAELAAVLTTLDRQSLLEKARKIAHNADSK